MGKPAEDTKTFILKTALQLFLRKGYKDVSYNDLITETGLSKGALYHHFPSKEELLVEVFEFFTRGNEQPATIQPEKEVKDIKSFHKLFIATKTEQIKSFKNLLGIKTVKFNKMLFFLEAIGENEKLKKIVVEILSREKDFLEKCFTGMKKHKSLPKGKDPALLAQSLFWMLQGAEMIAIFVENDKQEEKLLKMYDNTLDDFFKLL